VTISEYLLAAPCGEYPITDESKRGDLQKLIDEQFDFKNDFRLYIEGNVIKKCPLTYDDVVWKQNDYNERMAKQEVYFGFKK